MQLVIDNESERILAIYENRQQVPIQNFGDVEVVNWPGELVFSLDQYDELPRDPRGN